MAKNLFHQNPVNMLQSMTQLQELLNEDKMIDTNAFSIPNKTKHWGKELDI